MAQILSILKCTNILKIKVKNIILVFPVVVKQGPTATYIVGTANKVIRHLMIYKIKTPRYSKKKVWACKIFFGLQNFVCDLPFGPVMEKTSREDCKIFSRFAEKLEVFV